MKSALAIGVSSVLAVAGAGLYGAHRLLDRVDEAGYQRGLAEGRTACHAADLSRFSAVVADIETQAVAARQASRELERALVARRESDRRSTRELRDVLAESAAARADCSLPDGVMRQLAAARARAARAAAEGLAGGADVGVRGAGDAGE